MIISTLARFRYPHLQGGEFIMNHYGVPQYVPTKNMDTKNYIESTTAYMATRGGNARNVRCFNLDPKCAYWAANGKFLFEIILYDV